MVLVTGASGYVGGLLWPRLAAQHRPLRLLTRRPGSLCEASDSSVASAAGIDIAEGDVLDRDSLEPAMQGVHTAYYLVHSMGSAADFETQDRHAAENFAAAARTAGVERIVYLGGLGDDQDPSLSPHLKSRHEVGRILAASGVPTIEFRSSAILGSGSLSFELIRSLTDRLPVMICPRWLSTPTQPIACDDLIAYLVEAESIDLSGSRVFEIGSDDVVTYGELIQEYARQRGLTRWLISVPVLTPYLSGLWLGLVTPARAEVGRHLIEGLRNPTVVTDQAARQVFSVRPMSIPQAMQAALRPHRQ